MQYSPLGGLVEPGKSPHISPTIRSQLPGNVTVQLDVSTHMATSGEEIIVYSLDKYYSNPAIAVFVEGKLVKLFRLQSLVKSVDPHYSDINFAFLSHAEVPTPTSDMDMFSFHNYGDGSATILMAIIYSNDSYKLAFSYWGIQSQIRYFTDVQTTELWDGEGDGDCVWCPETF